MYKKILYILPFFQLNKVFMKNGNKVSNYSNELIPKL